MKMACNFVFLLEMIIFFDFYCVPRFPFSLVVIMAVEDFSDDVSLPDDLDGDGCLPPLVQPGETS